MIHTVRFGETIYGIARDYAISTAELIRQNELEPPYTLVPGMTLLILRSAESVSPNAGETPQGLAERVGISLNRLLQYNPGIDPGEPLRKGETLTLRYEQTPGEAVSVLGYTYPFIGEALLQRTLPYLTALSVFTYGFRPDGSLIAPQAGDSLVYAADRYGSSVYLELATLNENDSFDSTLLAALFRNEALPGILINNLLAELRRLGAQGVEIDFEYIPLSDKERFLSFLRQLADALHDEGYLLSVALAPKTRDDQPGLLYESHDYAQIGEIADGVLLMTYEWGYKYGPPQAVAPLPNVRRVLDYALTRIPAEKILLGFPNYGYDWPLPYERGMTVAETISNRQAVERAIQYGTEIIFDETAGSPYYYYTDENGIEHVVWFEDLRSAAEKEALAASKALRGLGIWTVMRPFPGFFLDLAANYAIR